MITKLRICFCFEKSDLVRRKDRLRNNFDDNVKITNVSLEQSDCTIKNLVLL